jgi:aspartokinase
MATRKRERLDAALAACGAVLKRSKKHFVYALPNGNTLTVSATPGDAQAELNSLSDLRKALGQTPTVAVVNPPRPKSRKPVASSGERWTSAGLAGALAESGVKESADLVKAREVESKLRWRVLRLEQELTTARKRLAALEQLRVVRWWFAVHRWMAGTSEGREGR